MRKSLRTAAVLICLLPALPRAAASGVETVLTMNQFEPFVISTFSRQGTPSIGADETRAFGDALAQGRATLAVLLDAPRTLLDAPGPNGEFAARLRDRFFGFHV